MPCVFRLASEFKAIEETMSKCRNGHDKTQENTYTRKDGRTECRVCKNTRSRTYTQNIVRVYAKPDQVALDRGHTEDNIGAFLVLGDVLKSERVKQGSLATVGMATGVNPISLGERERGLKNKLKAVARFADLLGLEVSFSIRRKDV